MSISSRINRPSYVDINPFTTYIDSHTIQSGNSQLLPEKSYAIELGYTLGISLYQPVLYGKIV